MSNLTLFRISLFGAVHQRGIPKIGHTYPMMMNFVQLYHTQRRTKKHMNHVTHPSSSADISIFHQESANFTISRNTYGDCILIYNF